MASTPSRRDDIRSMGCLMLFGLPFAAVGTFMGWMIFSSLRGSYEMRSWSEVPATILEADLESHDGDDTTTYRVQARYRYQVEGRSYESDRVTLHGEADNIGHYHEELARTLERYESSGEPYPCFVDPEDPTRAILDRRPRWGMVGFYSLFLLTFGGVGWGMIVGSLLALKKGLKALKTGKTGKAGTSEAERESDPTRPWLEREEWAEGLVRYSDRGPAFGILIFAMLWNLISAPLLFILPEEIEKGNHPALLGLLFPLVGAGLVVWAARGLLRWRKYGESTLFLDRVPVPLGGMLQGRVEIGALVAPEEGFEWTLSCVLKQRKSSGNEGSSERLLWQDKGRASFEGRRGRGAHTVIPLSLEVPADEAETTLPGDGGGIASWRLELEAEVEGVDYRASFEVPIFAVAAPAVSNTTARASGAPGAEVQGFEAPTPEDAAAAAAWQDLPRSPTAVAPSTEELAAAGVETRPLSDGGQRFYLPMARQPGTAISLTLFWLLWNGAIVFMAKMGAPWIFPLVFAFFSLLITVSVLDLWFGTYTIEAGSEGLLSVVTVLGVGRRAEIPHEEIEAIEVEKGTQAGSRLYYQVVVKTAVGKKRTAAARLPGRRSALALKAAIEAALDSVHER